MEGFDSYFGTGAQQQGLRGNRNESRAQTNERLAKVKGQKDAAKKAKSTFMQHFMNDLGHGREAENGGQSD